MIFEIHNLYGEVKDVVEGRENLYESIRLKGYFLSKESIEARINNGDKTWFVDDLLISVVPDCDKDKYTDEFKEWVAEGTKHYNEKYQGRDHDIDKEQFDPIEKLDMPSHLDATEIEFDPKYFKMDKMYNVSDADKFVPDFGYPVTKEHESNFYYKDPEAVKRILDKMNAEDGGKYDDKGNSSHYQSQFMEFIRDQERKYGTIVAMIVCQSNVDKYNQRAGLKEGVPAEKDLTKRDWYLKAFNHFKKKVEGDTEGRNSYVPVAEEIMDLFSNAEPKYVPLSIAIEKK